MGMTGREKLDAFKADGLPRRDRSEEYKRLFEANTDRNWRIDWKVKQQVDKLGKEIAEVAEQNFRLRVWLSESEGRMDDALAWYRGKVHRQREEINRQAQQIQTLNETIKRLRSGAPASQGEVKGVRIVDGST